MSSSLTAKRVPTKAPSFAADLLRWWDSNRRVLPWRALPGDSASAYHVWLSEILLQQTSVAAATPYFHEFLRRWPRIEELAAARIEDVISAFAGLGYYSRARNLHACAKVIAARGGQFPRSQAELLKLPGIGAYTAAAIAAIAFGDKAAPVDGNIARILCRVFAIEAPAAKARNSIAALMLAQVPAARPGDFAQAMMDLGAMICRPRNPACADCPLQKRCKARAAGDPHTYPRKLAKAPRPMRYGAVFYACRSDGAILARRRPPSGLLGATLELPGGVWAADRKLDAQSGQPFAAPWRALPGVVEQVFTHFALRLSVYAAKAPAALRGPEGALWIKPDDIGGAGFSSVMRKAIAHALKSQ